MPNLTAGNVSSLDPDPFGYTPPDVSGGNYTAPAPTYYTPPPDPSSFDPGGLGYSPPAVAPTYTPPPQYAPAAPSYAAPAPSYYAPAPQVYDSASFDPGGLGYQPSFEPTYYTPPSVYDQAQSNVGQFIQDTNARLMKGVTNANDAITQYNDMQGLDQSFVNYAGQQNADAIRNTYGLAMPGPNGEPAVRPEYAGYLFQNDIAPRANDKGGYDFKTLETLNPLTAPLDFLSTFGSAERSFGLPKLDVPILGDTIDAALSPLSIASAGAGILGNVGALGAKEALIQGGQQALTRGLPAIAGSTAGSEGARAGLEAVNAPGWLTEAGAQIGALAGGVAGWQAPELSAGAVDVGRTAITAARESPTLQAAAKGARAGVLGPAGLITGAVPGEVPLGGRTIAGLSDEGASALQKVNDALREEVRIRRSGTAADEIRVGRAGQAAGITEGFNDALGMGKSFDETQAAIRAGAKSETGALRQTFAKAIDLTDTEKTALLNDLGTQAQAKGKAFDIIRGADALSKLVSGEGLQPAEIKLLRNYFGDEVAKLATEASAGRPSIVAELDDAARARITAAGQAEKARYRSTGEAIARQEEIAKAQKALADKLQEAAHLDPTNKRLQAAADGARARGLRAATEADRLEADLAARAWSDLENKRVADVTKGNAAGAKAASKAAEAADKLNPSQQTILDEVRRVMAEVPSSTPRGTVGGIEPLNREAVNALENWMRSQNVLSSGVSDETGRISSFVGKTIQGNTADSFTTAVLVQREILTNALKQTGMDETIARKVADMMSEWSVRQRIPNSTPASIVAKERTRIIAAERAKGATLEAARAKADADVAARFNTDARVQRVLDALKEADAPAGRVADAASTLSSEFKNTMFGIGDVAVLGQQGMKAGSVAWPNIVAGLVNRILSAAHLPSLDVTGNGVAVGRRTQEILDGLQHNVATGVVNPDEGTLLRHLPFGAGNVDRPISAAIRWMTDLQFNKVLGNIRSLNYEGNLVLLKALGQDVTDPAVRQAAARSANVHTSAGQLAMSASRRTLEQGLLLSPSMMRARGQEIGQLLRALGPGATGAERILAASAAFSIATSVLAVGKLVNDTIGLGEFEFDPSKPGFGKITIPTPGGGSRVVSLFPQTQLANLLARSSRALAEGDTETLTKQLGSFTLASMSPVAGNLAKAAGFGFDPDQTGWAFGDYGTKSDPLSRILQTLPIPPIGQALIQGERNMVGLGLNVAGVSSFPESAYSEASRRAGVESFYRDLTKEQQQAFLLDPKNADVAQKLAEEDAKRRAESEAAVKEVGANVAFGDTGKLAEAKATRTEQQTMAAERFAQSGDGQQFREDLANASQNYYTATGTIKDILLGDGKPPTDAQKVALDAWFRLYDSMRDPISTKVADYDALEAAQAKLLAGFTPEQRKAIEDIQNRSDPNTPQAVTDYYAALDKISASGYWEVRDGVYQKWLQATGATFTGTEDQYWDAVRKDAEQRATQLLNSRDPNWRQKDPSLLAATTDIYFNQAYNRYSGYVADAQAAWRIQPQNREVAKLLATYGFGGTGQAETGVRIGELAR